MRIKVVVSALIILLSSCSNFDIAEKKEKPIEYKYGYINSSIQFCDDFRQYIDKELTTDDRSITKNKYLDN